jgi:orotate phosphoribosyltransferase
MEDKPLKPWARDFLDLAMRCQALRFGEFTLKSGRRSPYFFNAGQFHDGASLDGLARCYAQAIVDDGLAFDMLFGPAYKGIPLVAAVAVSLHRDFGRSVPWAFDRKEVKGHGEGGKLVGAPLDGRVLIIDDVISAGTSVNLSRQWISDAGATPCGVAVALDRQERIGEGTGSAVGAVRASGLAVITVAKLDDLLIWLQSNPQATADQMAALKAYQREFGSE